MKLVYPVLLEYDGNDYIVQIPDFGITEYGEEIFEILEGSKEDIALNAGVKTSLNKPLPEPSQDLEAKDNQILLYLPVETDDYKDLLKDREVYTEVTLPVELAEYVQETGLNLSDVLISELEKRFRK